MKSNKTTKENKELQAGQFADEGLVSELEEFILNATSTEIKTAMDEAIKQMSEMKKDDRESQGAVIQFFLLKLIPSKQLDEQKQTNLQNSARKLVDLYKKKDDKTLSQACQNTILLGDLFFDHSVSQSESRMFELIRVAARYADLAETKFFEPDRSPKEKKYQDLYDHFKQFTRPEHAELIAKAITTKFHQTFEEKKVDTYFITNFSQVIVDGLMPGFFKELDELLPFLEKEIIAFLHAVQVKHPDLPFVVRECLLTFRDQLRDLSFSGISDAAYKFDHNFNDILGCRLIDLSSEIKRVVNNTGFSLTLFSKTSEISKKVLAPLDKKYQQAREYVFKYTEDDIKKFNNIPYIDKQLKAYNELSYGLRELLADRLKGGKVDFEIKYNELEDAKERDGTQNYYTYKLKHKKLIDDLAGQANLDGVFQNWLKDKDPNVQAVFKERFSTIKSSAMLDATHDAIFGRAKRKLEIDKKRDKQLYREIAARFAGEKKQQEEMQQSERYKEIKSDMGIKCTDVTKATRSALKILENKDSVTIRGEAIKDFLTTLIPKDSKKNDVLLAGQPLVLEEKALTVEEIINIYKTQPTNLTKLCSKLSKDSPMRLILESKSSDELINAMLKCAYKSVMHNDESWRFSLVKLEPTIKAFETMCDKDDLASLTEALRNYILFPRSVMPLHILYASGEEVPDEYEELMKKKVDELLDQFKKAHTTGDFSEIKSRLDNLKYYNPKISNELNRLFIPQDESRWNLYKNRKSEILKFLIDEIEHLAVEDEKNEMDKLMSSNASRRYKF